MRNLVFASISTIGITIASVNGAGAIATSPAVGAMTNPLLSDVYYYHGRYYPYRYNGHYYSYRYHGHYYHHRSCHWVNGHRHCRYW